MRRSAVLRAVRASTRRVVTTVAPRRINMTFVRAMLTRSLARVNITDLVYNNAQRTALLSRQAAPHKLNGMGWETAVRRRFDIASWKKRMLGKPRFSCEGSRAYGGNTDCYHRVYVSRARNSCCD